jgi:iron complex outermembrane recepter protein
MNYGYLVLKPGFVVWVLCVLLIVGAGDGSFAEPAELNAQDLTRLSLEELMNVQVTSVSKKRQSLQSSAAAIFVITQEDIRRSGVTSIPEALRMAPGVEVARLSGNNWAITARGFNGRFANKLLVLIDGRDVYNPLFAGALWETLDTMMEDIDRIEVIRGPGATLYGVNAVNGVINIITKNSQKTSGILATAIVGSEETIGGLRYSGAVNDDLHYRVFAKYFNRDDQFHPLGAHDDWRGSRLGFRTDWNVTARDRIMIEGETFDQNNGERITLPTALGSSVPTILDEDVANTGGNLLLRWNRQLAEGQDLTVQMSYDRLETEFAVTRATIDVIDLDFQHRFPFLHNQEIVWGGEYRFWADQLSGSRALTTIPGHQSYNLLGGFIQDEIQIVPNILILTAGTKLSHTHFTGFEYQPSARLLWNMVPHHTVWVAVSRAVRVPSRLADQGAILQPPPPVPVAILGNQQLESEVVHAFEVGYRVTPWPQLLIDMAGFYNMYEELRGSRRVTATSFQFVNNKSARNFGFELATTLQLTEWWKLKGTYSHHEMDVTVQTGVVQLPDTFDGGSPRHQGSLRSMVSLPHEVEFDTWLRYVDELPSFRIPSYVELDVRVGWRPMEGLELAVVGQNLLDPHHPEIGPTFLQTQMTEVQRSVYGKVTWTFDRVNDLLGL